MMPEKRQERGDREVELSVTTPVHIDASATLSGVGMIHVDTLDRVEEALRKLRPQVEAALIDNAQAELKVVRADPASPQKQHALKMAYRRPTPVWGGFGYQVNACPGDKIEVAASLKVHPGIDRGLLQIPETLPWHVDLAALSQEDRDYLRKHCEPDLPCAAHYKVTVVKVIRPAPIAGETREGEYVCHTEPSGTPFCRVPGTSSVIATLDAWR